jgi:alpha-1,2-mannosyltransferase
MTSAGPRTRTGTIVWLVAAAVFFIVNLVNTVNKGGDYDTYYDAGRRLMSNQPLYAESTIAQGFIGPPAQALLFVPFAFLPADVSRLFWYLVNVALLWYGLTTWLGLLVPQAAVSANARGIARPAWYRGTGLLKTKWAVLPVLAVAYPLQTQFEHQNLNVVLLAIAAYSADAFVRDRPLSAGVALGVAAAIKVYPVLAVIWVGLRREWRAFSAAVAAAVAVSLAPALLRGVGGFMTDLSAFQTLAASGWPTRRASQSLVAMWGRYLLGEDPTGYPTLTFEQPLVVGLAAATAGLAILPLIILLWRSRRTPSGLVEELVCVGALAILISPIAWEHYWLGFFPLFLLLYVYAERRGSWQSTWARLSFWIGFVCITLLSRPFVGWTGARAVRAWSLMTWGGVLMCAVCASILAARRPDDRAGFGPPLV